MRSAAVRIDEAVGRRLDRRVVAGGSRGGHPLLGLQRSAGNAAVVAALRVQRSCCGGCAAGGACQKDEMPLQREVDQATASRNSAGDPEPLSMQPVGLRDVLLQSSKDPDGWWSGLDHQRRMALVDVYNRLTTFGLWQHVRAVKRVVKGEAPWHGLQAPAWSSRSSSTSRTVAR